ncbi:MAG: hypothetical protein IPO27_16295 [Bacteroidetes bacterium]|nr:hypothetical protein [Bacteroidota bacterium]
MMTSILLKPKGFCLWVFCFAFNFVAAQTFNKTIHEGVDGLFNILENDSSYFGVMTSGYPFWPKSLSILKINTQSFITKKKISYGSACDVPYGLIKLNSDTMVAGSFAYNNSNNLYSNYLFYFNENMDSLDTKFFASPLGNSLIGLYILKSMNGQIIITGQITDTNHTTGDCYLSKIDDQGNLLWTSTFWWP